MSVLFLQSPKTIVKRDGGSMPFDSYKIRHAIEKAAMATNEPGLDAKALDTLTTHVLSRLHLQSTPTVEHIQDLVEQALITCGFAQTAKAYILYREDRKRKRETGAELMQLYKEISFSAAADADLKRENANIDADSAMGTMLKYGSEGAKHFVDKYILPEEMDSAHKKGEIHIHDKDFYLLTETCCQIDLIRLFENGFSTGHGYLRKPNSIQSYSALACIAIQANQNEMHGGQSIPNFDFAMAPGVEVSWRKALTSNAERAFSVLRLTSADAGDVPALKTVTRGFTLSEPSVTESQLIAHFQQYLPTLPESVIAQVVGGVIKESLADTDRATYQAMEAFIHNLNTMNSRAGAQVPFSSVNYGTDTSLAGRLVVKNLLEATRAGLGNGETAIFPVQIFKVKEGVNYNPQDPNYDLFRLAMQTSAERLFPNFSFLDAPFNAQYYREGDSNSEVAYMGCRTRVIGNTHDPDREVTGGRGNLSFTSINLPRIGLESNGNWERFFEILNERMEVATRQLLHRYRIQGSKTKKNYPFLMGQGIWLDSEKLKDDEPIAEVLKHGTLTIGFIGLAETLTAMTGSHHGESEVSREQGLGIIRHMREFTDSLAESSGLNFSLIATPAEGLSGRFVRIDKKRFGVIPGVTDREYYTNSFHIPVYYPVAAHKKIEIEAPYHALTNAGHITYVEMDGDTAMNLPAFEAVIRRMKEAGIGYGSVNHPVDRDPECGYTGVIHDTCPRCGRTESKGPKFQRIRRITGYLVGTTDRFNDAKAKEEKDRVIHRL